ncbi:dual specificity protein phosphatase 22-B isoform X1 [Oncorhynchus tshawytscha]|nr:dual specificity protein phosphatase 22-B isoform X1 [Oncorhynchus tshawytscha]
MVNLLYGILTMCLSKQAACMQRTITVQQVLPDLYLGNFKDARDREQLTRNNITHILSIHDSAAPILPGMTYLCISAADLPTQNLRMHFKQSIMFIHESRLKGEGCLVHCLAGVSRSVTLVVAYIMTVTGLGWQEALAAVRVARPCAGPNLGFQRQLQEFETNHADQFREWLWQLYKERPFNDEDDIRILLAKSFKPNGVGVEVNVEPSTPPGLQGT